MWEDVGAWNSYASDPSMGGSFAAYSPSYTWDSGTDYSWGGGQESWWNQNPESSWNAPAPTPKYQAPAPVYRHGAATNPTPQQMVSGARSGEEVAQRFLGGGASPSEAHTAAYQYRKPEYGMEMNPYLRDAEHYLYGNRMMSNPIMNTTGLPQLMTAGMAPGYSFLKWAAQNAPEYLQRYFPQYVIDNFVNASPPSWSEVWSGVKPIWR